ncbi:MAG: GNAT family N-acetyltransferase [Anaerolineales bacterium]
MTLSDNQNIIVCRPALQKDTAEVMELCSYIWEGNDYIPDVWGEWLADPDGLLGVAEYHGRVVGVFKLTKFQEREWYMEGLRVHPDYRDRGIASHIHEYVVETWRRMGSGIIRLVTGSYNVKVHRMCEETGFKRVAEFIPYRAAISQDGKEHWSRLKIEEAAKALEFMLNNPVHALSRGLINLGWVYADPQLKHIQEAAKEGHAWWWRDGQGFISIWEDEEEGERQPGIEIIACRLNDIEGLLKDFRNLMGDLGYKSVGWVAPNHPEVISSLEKAGFERSWDMSLYAYELNAD